MKSSVSLTSTFSFSTPEYNALFAVFERETALLQWRSLKQRLIADMANSDSLDIGKLSNFLIEASELC